MYKLKQEFEDFIVEEVLDLNVNEKGTYSYYLLEKKDYTTIRALEKISQIFHINLKKMNFAGTKDRRAITKQYVSILDGPKKDLDLGEIKLTFLGRGNNRLNLGVLKGNNFKIIVRNISSHLKIVRDFSKKMEKYEKPKSKNKFVNYFGEQRFSTNNAEVGKLLLQRKFKEAISLMDEKQVNDYLIRKPNDYIGAIRAIRKKNLMFYIHAYQSKIWNEIARELSRKNDKNKNIPLVGFSTELAGEIGTMINKKLDYDNITQRDFIFREFPELTQEGANRNLYAEAENLKIGNLEEDELNKGKKKVLVEFFLPKGSYATEFIKFLFS